MNPGAAALLITLAIAGGWHTARFHRARKDLDGARDGVKKATRTRAIERKPFMLVAAIAFIVIWWWINRHTG